MTAKYRLFSDSVVRVDRSALAGVLTVIHQRHCFERVFGVRIASWPTVTALSDFDLLLSLL